MKKKVLNAAILFVTGSILTTSAYALAGWSSSAINTVEESTYTPENALTAGVTDAVRVNLNNVVSEAKEAEIKTVAAKKKAKKQSKKEKENKAKKKKQKASKKSAKAAKAASEPKYYDVPIPEYGGAKTYEGHRSITSRSSRQYKLQTIAETNNDGFRVIDGRYLVALGTGTKAICGQYADLLLKNGTVIPCIMGDAKAPEDTDAANLMTSHSKCVSEFIMDTRSLPEGLDGDVSKVYDNWDSPVGIIRVYDKYVPNFEP